MSYYCSMSKIDTKATMKPVFLYRRKNAWLLASVFLFFICSFSISAQIVYLSDGNVISNAKIIQMTPREISFKFKDGAVKTYDKHLIKRIIWERIASRKACTLRGLAAPGIGQFCSNRYWSGAAFTLLGVASLGYLVSSYASFAVTNSEFNKFSASEKKVVNNLGSGSTSQPQNLIDYKEGRAIKQKELDQDTATLTTSFLIMLAVASLSAIDTWFNYPSDALQKDDADDDADDEVSSHTNKIPSLLPVSATTSDWDWNVVVLPDYSGTGNHKTNFRVESNF